MFFYFIDLRENVSEFAVSLQPKGQQESTEQMAQQVRQLTPQRPWFLLQHQCYGSKLPISLPGEPFAKIPLNKNFNYHVFV